MQQLKNNVKVVIFLIGISIFYIQSQQTPTYLQKWLQAGKHFLNSQKQSFTQAMRSVLRRPSIVGAVTAAAAIGVNAKRARAETIFIAEDEQGNIRDLTPAEHEIAYRAKLSSQFPTALRYDPEKYDPNANETNVIQKKINDAIPGKNIQAVFVPTTIYELKALELMEKGRIKIENPNVDYTGKVNELPAIKKADLLTNNALVHQLKDVLNSQPKTMLGKNQSIAQPKKQLSYTIKKNNWHEIANSIITDFNSKYELNLHSNDSRDLISRSIDADLSAYDQNKFLLWRGLTISNQNEFYLKNSSPSEKYYNLKKTLSYGSSLFGGCIYDIFACPYAYINPYGYRRKNLGYALPITKGRDLEQTLYIPPLNAMSALISKGELFHPRLKWASKSERPSYGIKTMPSSALMQGTKGEKQHHISNFLQHIYSKAVPLTPETESMLKKNTSVRQFKTED